MPPLVRRSDRCVSLHIYMIIIIMMIMTVMMMILTLIIMLIIIKAIMMINNVEDNNSNIGNDYNNDINKNKEPCGVEFTTNRGEEI